MPPPISMMLFAFVMSVGTLGKGGGGNVCQSTWRYCGGGGVGWGRV